MKKRFLSVLVLVCIIVSITAIITVNASAKSYSVNIGTSYYSFNVESSAKGRDFYIKVYNASYNWGSTKNRNDVRMIDKNGKVVWEEYGAIAWNGSRNFWCGSNVAKVQVRTQYGIAAVYAYDGNAKK